MVAIFDLNPHAFNKMRMSKVKRKAKKMTESIIELKSEDFESKVKQSKRPAVVWVWASWCHNCKSMEPFFHEAAKTNQNKALFFKLKADDNRNLVKQFKVMGVPTTLFFSHGYLVERKTGIQTEPAISRQIDPLLDYTPKDAESDEIKGWFRWPFRKKKRKKKSV